MCRTVDAAIVWHVDTFDENSASIFLRTALAAARKAAEISRSYYAGNFTVTTKEDLTPVTQADVECEQAIRQIILDEFPNHGFFGEETGRTRADAEYLWLVDPIDGTKGFVRQYPFFSTQIALMHDGEIVLGVSSGTMMDELAWAEKGEGAWLNGARLEVSSIDDPDRAAVSTGNLKSLAGMPSVTSSNALIAFAATGTSITTISWRRARSRPWSNQTSTYWISPRCRLS